MSASIDVTGLERFTRSLTRAAAGQLQKELVDSLHKAGPKIGGDIQAAAFTKIQRQAASSVEIQRTTTGVDIQGGGGGGLPRVLWAGGEYGGRKSRKVSYATRSPRGTAYFVRRRTTMQFMPHLGREGYFYWPTIRDWLPKLVTEQEKAIDKALS